MKTFPATGCEQKIWIDLQWFASAEEEGRTEEPSELKLRKAREEGRVPKSSELNSAIVMLLTVLSVVLLGTWLFDNCIDVLLFYFQLCTQTELYDGKLAAAFYVYFIKMVLPVALISVIAAIAANLVQNKGFLYSSKPLEPKFSKVIPKFGEYFRKTLFSFEGAFNVVKSLVKVIVIFCVAFVVIKGDLHQLLSLMNVGLWPALVHIGTMAAKILIFSAVIFLVIAVPDYLVQKKQFMESMKMSKQEVKEEYKTLEGDPFIKSRLRQYMQEMLIRNMPADVAKSDVVIANPTHYAVAVRYDKQTMQGPMVMAKGADSVAQNIKRIAKENNVPIVENKPLARALYAEVEIGDIIPENYYQALAVILAKVYTMKKKL